MGAESRIFIWQTVAGGRAGYRCDGRSIPVSEHAVVALGGVLTTIIAVATLYFLQGKTDGPARAVNMPVPVSKEAGESKRTSIWYAGILVAMWVVVGVYMTYVERTTPEYKKGLSNQEIMDVKEELSRLKPRTVTIECANTDCSIQLINAFHYLLLALGWPHSMDDPEADIMLPIKHAEGVKGLQLSPNDETTRALKKAIEEKTKLTVNLLGKPERGNTSGTILLLVGSPP